MWKAYAPTGTLAQYSLGDETMWTVYVVVMVHKSFHRGHPIRWHALFVAQKMTVHIGHQKGSFVFAFTSLTPVLNINNRSRMMRSRNWYPYLHVKHAELGGMARGQNHIGQIRLQAWFLLVRGVKWKDYNTAGVVESWKVLGVKKSLFIPTSLLFPHPPVHAGLKLRYWNYCTELRPPTNHLTYV